MISISDLTVSITAAVAVKPSTIYSVKLDEAKSDKSWCIRRCYSDFYTLRQQFNVMFGRMEGLTREYPAIFAEFPKRSLFGSRRKSIVQHRVVALQVFLRQAIDCVCSPAVVALPSIYHILASALEVFLAVPTSSAVDGSTSPPLAPSGRLLAGKFIGRSGSLNSDTSHGTFSSDADEEDWSIAGDAVGLWAASTMETQSKPQLRRFQSDSVLRGENPVVFRELMLNAA